AITQFVSCHDRAWHAGSLLDDQGSLRRHVALFVDGVQVRDRRGLGDPLQDDSEIYVVQALSGG
ncbi:hypothetical protein K3Z89_08245, partial [Pseudomonas aeruginosa]|nr:hypothetical protein [Pseudomonas aeruginosa]